MYKHENYRKFVDVLIVVEHIVREMESAVLLKITLERRGLNVVIDTPKYNIHRLPIIYKPKVVVSPWAYGEREMKIMRRFRNKEGKQSIVINLHHEQISNSDSQEFLLPDGKAKNVYHLCWGQEFFDALLKHGCAEETLLPYGSLRMDFYFPPLNRVCVGKSDLAEKFGLSCDKTWLLFIANSFHLHTDKQKKFFESLGVDISEIGRVGISNTQQFLDSVFKLLEERSDVEVIYRPHPSMVALEDKCSIHDKVKNLSGYHMIFDGAIRDWIYASDRVLSFHSTSYIDSYFANKPFATFRYDKLNKEADYVAFSNYTGEVNNYNELLSFINIGEEEKSKYKVPADIVRQQFFNSESQLAYSRLSDFIFDKVHSSDDKDVDYGADSIYEGLQYYVNYFCKAVVNFCSVKSTFLRRKLELSASHRINNLSFASGRDYFTQKDVNNYQEKLEHLL